MPDEIEAKTLPLKLTVVADAKTTPVVETVSVKAEATSLTADGTSTTALTISLKDIAQQALSGQTVTLSTDIGTVSTAKDNGDGTYTATYTAERKLVKLIFILKKDQLHGIFKLTEENLRKEFNNNVKKTR